MVENLSLSALIYLTDWKEWRTMRWESFIISLDILMLSLHNAITMLRIFHYQPWYTYWSGTIHQGGVENLSLSALIYLSSSKQPSSNSWESFIISLDILTYAVVEPAILLRIFHYQPWYTYGRLRGGISEVENLSLSALIYLHHAGRRQPTGWESFIISLDILIANEWTSSSGLRIFHYQPWYTYRWWVRWHRVVENLSLSALIYLATRFLITVSGWESFIISLDILTYLGKTPSQSVVRPIFRTKNWRITPR